jgi:GntP family gluconate:H+ symporter
MLPIWEQELPVLFEESQPSPTLFQLANVGFCPELLVLATGTGSLILSHVNDPGFWMIQSFFKLEVKDTLAAWSVMETVLSVAGLGTTLLLASVLG